MTSFTFANSFLIEAMEASMNFKIEAMEASKLKTLTCFYSFLKTLCCEFFLL